MDYEALKYIGIGLLAFGMFGAALGVGNVFSSILNGIARNPSAEGRMTKYAFIGAGMAEAMGIFSFVLALMMLYK